MPVENVLACSYAKSLATRIAQAWLAQPFAAVLGIEHHRDERLPGSDDRRRYGDMVLTFYRTDTGEADRAIISAHSNTDSGTR